MGLPCITNKYTSFARSLMCMLAGSFPCSRIIASFPMWGTLKSFAPWCCNVSSMHDCRVKNPLLIFIGSKSLYALSTWSINPSIVVANLSFHCADWSARKKLRSKTFKSGLFAGCVKSLMFQTPCCAYLLNSKSSGVICAACSVLLNRNIPIPIRPFLFDRWNYIFNQHLAVSISSAINN